MNHMWAAITIVPIEIVPPKNPGDMPEVIRRQPDDNDTQYGCSSCSIPLSSETFNTECKVINGGH